MIKIEDYIEKDRINFKKIFSDQNLDLEETIEYNLLEFGYYERDEIKDIINKTIFNVQDETIYNITKKYIENKKAIELSNIIKADKAIKNINSIINDSNKKCLIYV